jgi:hypothetical protein
MDGAGRRVRIKGRRGERKGREKESKNFNADQDHGR